MSFRAPPPAPTPNNTDLTIGATGAWPNDTPASRATRIADPAYIQA
ncbi:MAG: hypothetical protein ABI229_00065 [Gemmatimonadaceae bacterium]